MTKNENEGQKDDVPEMSLTPRVRQTLQRAAEVATEHGVSYIGTDHMILAILDDPAGIAGSAIRQLGFEPALRAAVDGVLDKPKTRPPRGKRT
jgi:ATP-dependent Clp protease ATP-binding subunit ClpA